MLNETVTQRSLDVDTEVARLLHGEEGVWQESPLVALSSDIAAHASNRSTSFSMRERPFADLVMIRGNLADTGFVQAVGQVVGCEPPGKPNVVARGAHADVFWLGPDEWLIAGHDVGSGALEQELVRAFAAQFSTAVDVSSGYTIVELSGRTVTEVLSRGCPLDLDSAIFPVGTCAQSHFFKAGVILNRTGEESFDVVIRRSFADYFCRVLLDAAESVIS